MLDNFLKIIGLSSKKKIVNLYICDIYRRAVHAGPLAPLCCACFYVRIISTNGNMTWQGINGIFLIVKNCRPTTYLCKIFKRYSLH